MNQTFDLDSEKVGSVYAKALLNAAEAAGETEIVMEELSSLIHDVFDQSPETESWLASQRLTHEQRLPLLDQAFGGKMCSTLLTFLKVLSNKERTDCLRAIEHSARQLYNKMRNRVEVLVTAAQPLSEASTQSIINNLTSHLSTEVELRVTIDESLIGGLIIKLGDTVFDGSVANQLEQLRRKTILASQRQVKEDIDRFAQAEA